MKTYTHELTDIEEVCGITLGQVAEVMPRALMFDQDHAVALPGGIAPALAGSVARACFAGVPAVFAGLNELGHIVYRRAADYAGEFAA